MEYSGTATQSGTGTQEPQQGAVMPSGFIISVPREVRPGEQRVALTPEIIKKLKALSGSVRVETGAGELAGFSDADFVAAGADIISDTDALYQDADIVVTVNPPTLDQIGKLSSNSLLIGFLNPYSELERFEELRARQISALSMELIPRTSRAQSMDALSSQASIAGYKAVLMAASLSGKFFPMLTTA